MINQEFEMGVNVGSGHTRLDKLLPSSSTDSGEWDGVS